MKEHAALKEWAVTIKALDEGRQVLLLRKGGIHEKRFEVPHRQFYLYTTYEHQRADLLKPEYLPHLEATLAERIGPESVIITHWAEAADVYWVTEEETLAALAPFHIWTDDYAQKRLHWRPKHPLAVMMVRAYRLPQARILPVLPEYVGCTSWLTLKADDLSTDGMQPVVSDDEFAAQVAQVKAVLRAASPEEAAAG